MAWTVADGPAGLDGIHTWNGGAVVLNDRSGGMPYVRLSEITGLYDLPEADDLRDPNTGRQGEVPRPGFPRGKTSVYVGLVVASDPRELHNYCGALRAGFSERSLEHPMGIAPPAFAGGGPTWLFDAKVLGCSIPERQDVGMGAAPSPWQRTLTLTLRLSDGRFVVDAAPVDDGPFTAGSTQTITVDGTADNEPVFTGTVTAAADVLLENFDIPISSGGHAFLRFLDIPVSGTLHVDFAQRSAYIVDGSSNVHDLWGFFDPTSNWQLEQIPGLIPGGNDVKVTGASAWHVAHAIRSW